MNFSGWNKYDLDNYDRSVSYKYSPILAGVFSYALSGTGHFYVGEPLRGISFLVPEIVLYGIMANTISNNLFADSPPSSYYINLLSLVVLKIWAIVDVVKISKIKNLAYNDKNLSLKIYPNLNISSYNKIDTTQIIGLNITIEF